MVDERLEILGRKLSTDGRSNTKVLEMQNGNREAVQIKTRKNMMNIYRSLLNLHQKRKKGEIVYLEKVRKEAGMDKNRDAFRHALFNLCYMRKNPVMIKAKISRNKEGKVKILHELTPR